MPTPTSPLSLFDRDRTYDLIFAQKINQELSDRIATALGDHSPFQVGKKLTPMLCDRYIPDNLAWSQEWTTIYYQFLKILSLTHLLTDDRVNGSAYGFTPEYTATIPPSLSLDTFPNEIILTVPKNETVSISWLVRNHSELASGQLCPQVPQEISIWGRFGATYLAPKDSDLVIKLDTSLWLHNSCVISGNGRISPNNNLILYSALETTLNNIISQIALTPCKVLTEFTVKDPVTVENSTNYQMVGRISLGINNEEQIEYSDPLFSLVPDYYYFASLIYANHNPFSQEAIIPKASLGKEITILPTYYAFSVKTISDLINTQIPEERAIRVLKSDEGENILYTWLSELPSEKTLEDGYLQSNILGFWQKKTIEFSLHIWHIGKPVWEPETALFDRETTRNYIENIWGVGSYNPAINNIPSTFDLSPSKYPSFETNSQITFEFIDQK